MACPSCLTLGGGGGGGVLLLLGLGGHGLAWVLVLVGELLGGAVLGAVHFGFGGF